MINTIAIIVFIASLATLAVLVFRKFSILSALDVSTIPQEKHEKTKEDIVEMRMKRKLERVKNALIKIWSPLGKFVSSVFNYSSKKASDLEKKYRSKSQSVTETVEINQQKTLSLLNEGDELVKAEDLPAAEKRYIEVIGLDHRNVEAYKKLGEIYTLLKDYEHAIESLQHAVKLNEEDASVYDEISSVYLLLDDKEKALMYGKEAVKLDPKNPKYLDGLVEKSIEAGDKFSAEDALRKLKRVNPENQKIEEFKQKISEMKL